MKLIDKLNSLENKKIISLICILVFGVFAHTLDFPWKHFDEQIIYDETILPIPYSLSEFFNFITQLGVNNHFEASSIFHSSVSNLRGTPLDVLFTLCVFMMFKKTAFAYHVFSLVLHIINSALCFLIINRIVKNNSYSFLLTLIWSLHPGNVESILFATNFGALVTYFFCFALMNYYFDKLDAGSKDSISLKSKILIGAIYLFPLFLNEYSVTFPVIIFLYIFSQSCKNLGYKTAFTKFTTMVAPLFFSLVIFFINFISLPVIRTSQENSITLILERVFWFSPQVFFHIVKTIFFPSNLSIDQSSHVLLSDSLITPYSVFCFIFMYGLILLSAITFFKLKNNKFHLLFTTYTFFIIALLPFLHIISPLYNIFSERYLYLPTFFLIFGVAHIFQDSGFRVQGLKTNKRSGLITTTLVLLCIFCGARTYTRSLDWKDSVALFSSTLKNPPNELLKGLREEMLGGVLIETRTDPNSKEKGNKLIEQGYKTLANSLRDYDKSTNREPEIIKAYGLDKKTLNAKTAYLLAYTLDLMNNNPKSVYNLLKPYMEDLSVFDTQLVDLYLSLALRNNDINEVERVVNKVILLKPSAPIFLYKSKVSEIKYKDKVLAERYLLKAFNYFPYDKLTLLSLREFYKRHGNQNKYMKFKQLLDLRNHQRI